MQEQHNYLQQWQARPTHELIERRQRLLEIWNATPKGPERADRVESELAVLHEILRERGELEGGQPVE